ncbi:MAG: hypothetical protein D6731_01725 [Planctomycetota bacterium]|nr:MAG: hypothetical protein D6731_01725 [Planctomycetota bacterium]
MKHAAENPLVRALLDAEREEETPRFAAQRMRAVRAGDFQRRRLLVRARSEGEAHRRSDSHEGAPLPAAEQKA